MPFKRSGVPLNSWPSMLTAGRAEDVPPDEFSQLQQQIGQRRAGDEAWQRAQSTLAAQVVRPDALLMEATATRWTWCSGGRARCSPILGQIAARPI